MTSTLPAPIDKLAIVVVTYKRQELLANLFDSMTELTATPWRIVIVDNENSRETEAMCAAFNERLANLWGIDTDQPDAQGSTDRVIYAPQLENGGGAGGFSAGTKCAYDLGASGSGSWTTTCSLSPRVLSAWPNGRTVTTSSRVRAWTSTAVPSFGSTSSSFRLVSPTPSLSGTWAPRLPHHEPAVL